MGAAGGKFEQTLRVGLTASAPRCVHSTVACLDLNFVRARGEGEGGLCSVYSRGGTLKVIHRPGDRGRASAGQLAILVLLMWVPANDIGTSRRGCLLGHGSRGTFGHDARLSAIGACRGIPLFSYIGGSVVRVGCTSRRIGEGEGVC